MKLIRRTIVAMFFLMLMWPSQLAIAQAKRARDVAFEETAKTSTAPFAGVLVGEWNYYSFILARLSEDADTQQSFDTFLFGNGVLIVEDIGDGRFRGRLDFGPNLLMELKGTITY